MNTLIVVRTVFWIMLCTTNEQQNEQTGTMVTSHSQLNQLISVDVWPNLQAPPFYLSDVICVVSVDGQLLGFLPQGTFAL